MYRFTKRFLRLSIASWLIIFSILCFVVFVYARFMRQPDIEASAIQDLRDLDIEVQALYEFESGPEWAKKIFGENVFARVNEISLHGSMETLDGCRDALARLSHLKHLRVRSYKLENVDALKGFNRLETIKFDGCGDIDNLDSLKGIASLKKLYLRQSAIEKLDLREWRSPNLEKVTVNRCSQLVSVSGFLSVGKNCLLDLEECEALEEIKIQAGSNLDFITITNCPTLDSIGVLPETLVGLGIYDCDSLTRVEGRKQTKLNSVELVGCNQLDSFDVSLESVEHVKLVSCDGIQDLNFHQSVPRLASVRIIYCDGMVAIDGLPESTEKLELRRCMALKRVTPDASLPNLKVLTIDRCPSLSEAPAMPVQAVMDESQSQAR